MAGELTDRERALLAFEESWPRHSGDKEAAIRADLQLTPTRYYQLLGRLIDTEPALAHDPLLVRRLRRVRDESASRRRARTAVTAR